MSDQHNASVLTLVSFAVGVVVGALMALFFAPMSGQEMRTRIRDEAQADWQRAADQLNQARADMRQQMDGMRQQMEAYEQQVREQITAQIDQLQAKIDKQAATEPTEGQEA